MRIIKFILRTVYYSFFVLAVLFILIAASIRFSPFVQTIVVQKLSGYASEKLGYPISIQSAKFTWLDNVTLGGLKINNPKGGDMIDIESLKVNFKLENLQDSTNLKLDNVVLTRPKIVLELDEITGKQNIDEFISQINKLLASSNPKKQKGRGQIFSIEKAQIIDGIFVYKDNQTKPRPEPNRFDETHFTIDNLNAKVEKFQAIKDTISLFADINGIDQKTGLNIKRLKTDFLICNKSMVFNKLYAHFGNTIIRDYLRFDFNSQKDMSDFYSKVHIKANFDSAYFAKNDLIKFIPDLKKYDDNWNITGQMNGTVDHFVLDKAKVNFGKNSRLKGKFELIGLPDIDKLFMKLNFINSNIQITDLKSYLDAGTVNSLGKLGHIALNGDFEGSTKKFKTRGTFETNLGKATTDLSMILNKNTSLTEYSGFLELNDFKIGELLGEEKQLKNITMSGNIKGNGLSAKEAVLDVNGSIKNIDFNGYQYRNLNVQGKLQKQLFEGNLSIKDSNLVFAMKGIVDLRNNKENFNLTGDLAKANLKRLKLSDQDISLKSKMNVSFSGTNIDNIFGFARLNEVDIRVDDRHLVMDTLYVFSDITDSVRDFVIDSDLLRLKLHGNYIPSIALADLQQLANEYKAYFLNNKYQRNQYYSKKIAEKGRNYSIDYSINLIDTKPLLAFVYPGAIISNYTPLEGTFNMGNTVMLNLTGKTDTLIVGDYAFFNSDFDFNTSKFFDNPEVLASGIINSEKQKLSILAPTEKLTFEGAWDKDKIVFESSIKQENNTNRADLNGNLIFTEYGMDLQFKRSKFKLLGNDWKINSENTVNITSEEVCFKYMTIENQNQIVAINGSISKDSLETLRINATNFDLATIAPVVSLDLSGRLNGEASINNITANMAVAGQIKIDSLVYKKLWIGDLAGESKWDNVDKLLNLNYYVDRENKRMLNLEGIYVPARKENSLDLISTLNQTNLTILEPFTEGLFSNFNGLASGQIHISGTPSAPNLEGEVNVKNGRVMVDYLKTIINFDDKIFFGDNIIKTDQLRLTDAEGHVGKLYGGVEYSDGLKNLRLNLSGSLNNFKILNTTHSDNDLFYGTAYATGKMEITGPLDNIYIKAKATTNKGTKIYIPLDGVSQVSNSDYIEYVTTLDNGKSDSLSANTKAIAKKTTSNIYMDFNFIVTPDAYCELQLDRQSGDLIKAYGNADLNMKVNTLGDFTLNGIYELERGDYSFNFENIASKQFKILPKSKIIWTGDPLEANLDIKAEYTQYTSLLPIFPQGTVATNELTRRYPVSVVLNLKDRMLSPKVSYGIDFKDYPNNSDFRTNVLAFNNRININEQDLGRQVGSLLLTQSLMSQSDAFKITNFTSNISEFLSNQLSKLASSKDFQVGINASNFQSLNQNLINSMQFQFSYNYNDRVRLSSVLSGNTAQSTGNNGTLFGDFSLEWLITKDGHLRLKGFNRNTPNTLLNSALNTSSTSYGASILYTKSFNYIFSKKKKPGLTNDVVLKTTDNKMVQQ
jgi:TamB, inner membrane protein subunit of TAM complex